MDGVSEAKSNSVSLDVYSSKFKNCRYIFLHKIVRPLKKGFVNNQEQLRNYLLDIGVNAVHIEALIADNPKRSNIRMCLNHNALFPCEYCFAKGVKYTSKNIRKVKNDNHAIIEKLKRIGKKQNTKQTLKDLKKIVSDLEENEQCKVRPITVWPSSTANKELRTNEKTRRIVSLIEENENNSENDPLTRDQLKGVVGRSLLLDWDNFDFTNNLPTEYMHLVCLGVVKRLTELTFNVGTNRPRITKRKLSSTAEFNKLMAETKVFGEFSRRARDLDFAVFKAEEFRNLILFFFPHVLECLEKSAKERDCWLYLAFMIRACVLPDNEFFNINVNQISIACTKFYKIYEKLFGYSNCTYSIHVLCCHLLQLRELGPLTDTSAFKFESFYGEIRNSFTPGTPSSLKQIFEKIFLKRALCKHSCEKSTLISNYETAYQSNSLVYTYTNDSFNIYNVIDIQDDEITCHPQGKFSCHFENTPELSWSKVGVFKKGASSKDIVNIPKNTIAGKVLKVGSYLITCPDNVLKEK